MAEETSTETAAPAPAATAAATPAVPAPAPAAPVVEQPNTERVEDLPDWAQKIITDARADAGKSRNTAKQQAADDARQEMAQTIGKALGLIQDETQTVDPAALTAQLTESAAELVVWRSAADLKVNAAAVTDSRGFARAIASLDPSSATFEADVKQAAQAAAENNPMLKATQAAVSSSAQHAGGSGEGAVSQEQFNLMTGQQRNTLARSNPALYDQLASR